LRLQEFRRLLFCIENICFLINPKNGFLKIFNGMVGKRKVFLRFFLLGWDNNYFTFGVSLTDKVNGYSRFKYSIKKR